MCGGERCPDCPEPTLLPDAEPAAVAYLRVSTQWRWAPAGMGGRIRTGLDYAACMPVLTALLANWQGDADERVDGLDVTELLEGVQIVELAWIDAQSEMLEARQQGAPV